MAKDFLSIPTTSVGCECEFSSSKDLITDKRNRLKKETIRECICVKEVGLKVVS